MESEVKETLPRWDLSSFYGNKGETIEQLIATPQIAADIAEAQTRAEALRNAYQGKNILAMLDGNALASVIAEYEKIDEIIAKPRFFFHLAEATHLQNPTVIGETARINKVLSEVEGNLVFLPQN